VRGPRAGRRGCALPRLHRHGGRPGRDAVGPGWPGRPPGRAGGRAAAPGRRGGGLHGRRRPLRRRARAGEAAAPRAPPPRPARAVAALPADRAGARCAQALNLLTPHGHAFAPHARAACCMPQAGSDIGPLIAAHGFKLARRSLASSADVTGFTTTGRRGGSADVTGFTTTGRRRGCMGDATLPYPAGQHGALLEVLEVAPPAGTLNGRLRFHDRPARGLYT